MVEITNFLYIGNPDEVEKMSAEKRQLRKDVYLQVLNEIQNIEGEKREKVLETLSSAITIPDLELMMIEEVELCAICLPEVEPVKVRLGGSYIADDSMEYSRLIPDKREFM